MTDKREFKINLEAAEPDDDFNASRSEKQPVKQSVRYTPSLTVLFAFMAFGIILVWMFYHFSTRLEAINTEGSSGIASLSSEFTDKVSGMSQQILDQKQATQALLTDLKNQVAKLKTLVSSLKTGKADTKDMEAAVNGIKKTITPFQASLAQLEEQLNAINRKTENIATSLKQIENSVSNNTSDISRLNENRIDKGYVDQQLKKERELHQQKMSAASESLLNEIASIETKISNMKQRMTAMENQLSRKSTTPNKMPSSTTPKSYDTITRPKPGEIIEQDLK